jgi:uncharacterized membrane protein YdjX (TVP38/TMEM64 family)
MIVGLVCYAAYDIEDIKRLFQAFIDFLQKELILSTLIIFAIYFFSVLFAFPIIYTSIALGYAFSQVFSSRVVGYFYGLTVITISIVTGGIAAFLLSRYWLSRTIRKRCLSKHRSFMAINNVITREGWRTVMLLRLTPFPFALVSYLLGITNVRLLEYSLASGIMAVHVAVWLYIG